MEEKIKFIAPAKEPGERLHCVTEKLSPFISHLKAIAGVIPPQEPITLYFGVNELQILVRLEKEQRYHVLKLHKSFFAFYTCPTAFRFFVPLKFLVRKLSKMKKQGVRVIEMQDEPTNVIVIRARQASSKEEGQDKTEKAITKECRITPIDLSKVSCIQDHLKITPLLKDGESIVRYPFVVQLQTAKLQSMLDELNGVSEVTLNFNGKRKSLRIYAIQDGVAASMDEIPAENVHVIPNPFSRVSSESGDAGSKVKSQVLNIDPHEITKATHHIENKDKTAPSAPNNTELDTFDYTAHFTPKSISAAVETIEPFVYLYMQTNEPLIIQYVSKKLLLFVLTRSCFVQVQNSRRLWARTKQFPLFHLDFPSQSHVPQPLCPVATATNDGGKKVGNGAQHDATLVFLDRCETNSRLGQ
jgi:hypothetical protein